MPGEKLDALVEPMLAAARIPGAAIAVVTGGETVFARGYGCRDLDSKRPMTPQTLYPIGSTTKAMNTTLLGMLVEQGQLDWDAPVRNYLPRFRLQDAAIGAAVTVRDLVTMRTGLGRHDFVWLDNPIGRAELIERLAHLDFSAGFREKFQYNNLTPATAGHLAEVITGETWHELVHNNIFVPLEMRSTGFSAPAAGNVSGSYHENSRRELVLTRRLASETVAPVGGSIYSTVEDMARWVRFNFDDERLAEIHAPQVFGGHDPAAPSPQAHYALGWWVDAYNGRVRLSHTGYLHSVSSSVMLFPQERIGLVSFVNFGCSRLARILNQYAFDLIMGFKPVQTWEARLAQYEKSIEDNRRRLASAHRVANASPSHRLEGYLGSYLHPGYGRIEICRDGEGLVFRRNTLAIPLEHWHFDAWAFQDIDLFEIHEAHAFDRANLLQFETNADAEIAAFSIQLERSGGPARFVRQ